MPFTTHDRQILRDLATRVAEIADLPEMAEGSRDFLRRMGDCPGRGYGVPRAGGWARFGAHPIERTREDERP